MSLIVRLQDGRELKIDEAKSAVGLSVGDIPYVDVVVPHAIRLEFGEQLAAAGIVKMVDARPAVRGHHFERFGIAFYQAWHKGAGALFEVAKDFHLVRKALIGLGPTKLFIDLAIVADAHGGAECVFDLLHEFSCGMRKRPPLQIGIFSAQR